MCKEETIKIILADAQPVFREGIKCLLNNNKSISIIQEAGNTHELLQALKVNPPDLLILDYNPFYFDADELNNALLGFPECKVIIISSQEKKWNIFKSLQFNVYCYLTKECGKHDISKAINAALRGEKFFCAYIVNILLEDKGKKANADEIGCLSEREKEITRQIALGKVNKEIAADLNLSPHTVHSHRKNIMKKLGLHSAVDLCHFAKETGLVD